MIDNQSTDLTAEAVAEWSRDPRLRILSSPGGLVQALQTGCAAARAPWLARMDADDVAHPDRFRVQLDFLRAHPGMAVCGCGVRIPEAEKRINEYPHQLSGGMRQRVMIAMALSCDPSILIADEPTTALDVTIQAQILGLMRELQQELDTAVIIITHDMGVVAEVADRTLVMNQAKLVESGDVHDIFDRPIEHYTKALLHAIG